MQDKVLVEYLRRSYFAVDGLWFMMLEDELSFEKALEMDVKVWGVVPKIQARTQLQIPLLEDTLQKQNRASPAQITHPLRLCQIEQCKSVCRSNLIPGDLIEEDFQGLRVVSLRFLKLLISAPKFLKGVL